MDTSYYTYDGKLWKPDLTVLDNNSFFHSAFGIKTNKHEAYFDKHARFRRMRWSTFLTYFENETMSPPLINCLSAIKKYRDINVEDKTFLKQYVSGILAADQPVALEEIPILSALENIMIVVLSDSESDPVTVFKPNSEIFGSYSHLLEQPKEAVLSLKENICCRLSPIDDIPVPKSDVKKNNVTEENQEPPNSHSNKYKKGGTAGSKGVEFQVNLLTIFLLNSLLKLKNWRLSTENKQAGKFDDIVLEMSDKSVVLLQAKHKENRKITFDQLLSVNSKNDDFSLPKYFFSYQEIKNKNKFLIKAVIICTNTNVDKKSQNFLNRQKVSSESMLHYEDGSCSFFTFNDEILSYLKQNINIYYENNLRDKGIDEGIISDENIEDFLKNLQFYCDYPLENNLQAVVEKILSRMKYSNSLWGRTSFQDISNKVTEWFKQPYGEYLTEDRAKSIFCEIKSDKYCEILEHYNVLFEHNDFDFTYPNRVFHVIADDGYLLHSIKIYRALRANKSKILYVNPEDNAHVQKQIIYTFEMPSYALLVFCSKIINNSLRTEIYSQLGRILRKYNYKKLIVVSESHDHLAQWFGLSDDSYYIIKEPVIFQDLTKDSQNRLLKKKNVVFQGHDISLEELFSEKTLETCQKAISPKILEMLVRGEKIKVGSEVQLLGNDISRYYIDRQFKRKAKTRDEIFSVDTIFEVNEKVIIISDGAGMGKSTILTKLAMAIKNRYPYLWVIRVELNDYTGILSDLLRDNREVMSVTELLDYKDSSKMTNHLEKFMFAMKGKVVLMLDGVDEISPDYTGLIVSLITQCQEASNFVKIFVTTRPHMSQELEGNLQVKPFILQKFTKQNQIDFLANYWMFNLKLSDANKTRCEQYAEALINKMSSWLKLHNQRENHFAAIPLHVRMLAEIFQENNDLEELTRWVGCKEYLHSNQVEPTLPAKMNITKLYKIFIDKKREVFFHKGNPSGNVAANQALTSQFDECLIYHRALALKYILEAKCKLLSCYRECDENIELNTLKIGIVQKFNNRYYFAHRTFAEYFVAESLLRELQLENPNVLFQKFLIEEILTYPEYNVIRSFFNSCLHNVVESLPSNVLEDYQFLIYEIDPRKKQKFNLIHEMASEGCVSILQFLFKCIGFNTTGGKERKRPSFYETNAGTQNQNKVFGNTLNIIQSLVARDGVNIKDSTGKSPLHYASKNGRLECVKFLIEQGADVDIRDSGDFVPLREAVKENHIDVVKFLIEQGADIKAKDRLGHTVLYEAIMEDLVNIASYILGTIVGSVEDNIADIMVPYAAAYLGQLNILEETVRQGDVNCRIGNGESLIFGAVRGKQLITIRYLVDKGADVNSKDEDGNTPLCLAALKGQLEAVKLLVECGADVNVGNNERRTALHIAASWGRLDTVEFFVNCGGNVNIGDSDGYTVLHLAAEEGLLDTVRFLVDRGADVNTKGYDHRTALFLAALQGELDTVKFLAERGTDVNYRDNDGSTALFLAAEYGELDTVRCLLECGADINIKDNDGYTVLHLAVLAYRHLDTVEFLVQCGAEVDIRNCDGRTALFVAIEEGNLDAVLFLVEAGANINVTDNEGFTALHMAVIKRQPEIIRTLVVSGAELNIKSNSGWTVLHLAAVWGNLDVVKVLFYNGADVRVRRRDGQTMLFLAVKKGHLNVIKFFIIEAGVDINIKNSIGRTVLHCAASSGRSDIVEFLTENGANIDVKDFYGNTAATIAKRRGHLNLLRYLEKESVKPIWTQLCFRCLK